MVLAKSESRSEAVRIRQSWPNLNPAKTKRLWPNLNPTETKQSWPNLNLGERLLELNSRGRF